MYICMCTLCVYGGGGGHMHLMHTWHLKEPSIILSSVPSRLYIFSSPIYPAPSTVLLIAPLHMYLSPYLLPSFP